MAGKMHLVFAWLRWLLALALRPLAAAAIKAFEGAVLLLLPGMGCCCSAAVDTL